MIGQWTSKITKCIKKYTQNICVGLGLHQELPYFRVGQKSRHLGNKKK